MLFRKKSKAASRACSGRGAGRPRRRARYARFRPRFMGTRRPSILGFTLIAAAAALASSSTRSRRVTAPNRGCCWRRARTCSCAPKPTRTAATRATIDPEAVTSQIQVVLSRDLAREVIKKENLADNPEFDPAVGGTSVLQIDARPVRHRPRSERRCRRKSARSNPITTGSTSMRSKNRASSPSTSRRPIPISPPASPTRSPRLISRCSRRRSRIRPAPPATGWPARSPICAPRWPTPKPRSRTIAPSPICLSAPTTPRCPTSSSPRSIRRSRRRAGRRPIWRRGRGNCANSSARASRSSPSDIANSESMRRLIEQRMALRSQLAEQSTTLLDQHPRIKELKAQIAEVDRADSQRRRAPGAPARQRRQGRRRPAGNAHRQPRYGQEAGLADQRAGRAIARARARGQDRARSARILSRQIPRGDRARQHQRRAAGGAHHFARQRLRSSRTIRRNCRPC